MRALALATYVVIAAFAASCAGPYAAPPERPHMPKKKGKKPRSEMGAVLPPEADTCVVDFNGPEKVWNRASYKKADLEAQTADNTLTEAAAAPAADKRAKVIDAIVTLKGALAADPYSPRATYTLAVAYARVGKRKCALAMLERLVTLQKIPEVTGDTQKYVKKVLKDTAFEPFRKDADAVVAQ